MGTLQRLEFLLLALAGCINRQDFLIIDYLLTENQGFREVVGTATKPTPTTPTHQPMPAPKETPAENPGTARPPEPPGSAEASPPKPAPHIHSAPAPATAKTARPPGTTDTPQPPNADLATQHP